MWEILLLGFALGVLIVGVMTMLLRWVHDQDTSR
jgi:hypothetical protein